MCEQWKVCSDLFSHGNEWALSCFLRDRFVCLIHMSADTSTFLLKNTLKQLDVCLKYSKVVQMEDRKKRTEFFMSALQDHQPTCILS